MTDTTPLEPLRARPTDGRAAVGVAGLGYVGLLLAVELARAGFRVTGIDPNVERVRIVGRCGSHVEALPVGAVAELVKAGRLEATSAWDGAMAFHAVVPRLRLKTRALESVPLTSDVVSAPDCVVIHTGHETVDDEWLVAHAQLVFDTRTATRDVGVDRTEVVRF